MPLEMNLADVWRMWVRRLVLVLMLAVAVTVTTREGRRLLENAYITAPFVLLRNRLRPILDQGDVRECLRSLRETGIRFRRLDPAWFRKDCPIANPVVIWEPLQTRRFVTCRLALALQNYTERLQGIALRHLGQRVRTLHDLGVRNCRPMTGHRFLLSEHAFSNAIDISAFELEDGELIEVKENWHAGDDRERFLREAGAAACSFFNMVITPDENEEHRDHFHFDMGRSKGCTGDLDPL